MATRRLRPQGSTSAPVSSWRQPRPHMFGSARSSGRARTTREHWHAPSSMAKKLKVEQDRAQSNTPIAWGAASTASAFAATAVAELPLPSPPLPPPPPPPAPPNPRNARKASSPAAPERVRSKQPTSMASLVGSVASASAGVPWEARRPPPVSASAPRPFVEHTFGLQPRARSTAQDSCRLTCMRASRAWHHESTHAARTADSDEGERHSSWSPCGRARAGDAWSAEQTRSTAWERERGRMLSMCSTAVRSASRRSCRDAIRGGPHVSAGVCREKKPARPGVGCSGRCARTLRGRACSGSSAPARTSVLQPASGTQLAVRLKNTCTGPWFKPRAATNEMASHASSSSQA
mmetsp:Transcript_2617/g.7709  ORF Transcript_2617/g.7709 Transcript_2617/m.7709 type:complete len:349 (+) Transcript_2617:416-1462(+)